MQWISVGLNFNNEQVIVSEVGSKLCAICVQLMETSGTDILNDSDVRAPVSPLHLAVSSLELLSGSCFCASTNKEPIFSFIGRKFAP